MKNVYVFSQDLLFICFSKFKAGKYFTIVLVYSVLRVQKDIYLSSYDGTKNEAIFRDSTNRPSVTIVCTGMFFLVIVLFGRAVCIYSYNSD